MTPSDKTAEKKSPIWKRTALQGLYQHENGTYYSRYRLNGTRTFRSLATDVWTVAKIKHAAKQTEVESDRQSGAKLSADFRTLGALAVEFRSRLAEKAGAEATRENYEQWLRRLEKNWPGTFQSTTARSVSSEKIVEVREQLLGTKFKIHNTKKAKRGYRPAVVNQTLSVLRLLLDLAVEKHVIAVNPFAQRSVFRESVYLPKRTRVPVLPSRADMDKVFAEMRKVPGAERFDAGRLAYLQAQADNSADHALFLAYTGARLEEANAIEIADDRGKTLAIRGTKSRSSDRVIPVHPALRALLDRLKGNRASGCYLTVKTSRAALARACKRVGVAKLRHHDLRHYFATVSIERGVGITTLAHWLGHSDRGQLAMSTYGHLRDDHSQAEAAKLNFGDTATAQSTSS